MLFRPGTGQPALFAADIGGHGAVVGRLLPQHHRAVEHADSVRCGDFLHAPAGLGRAGTGDADDGIGLETIEKPGLCDDLVHLLIACHHDDHDLGVIADLRRREARFRALLDRPTHGVHVHVVTGDIKALAQQVPRHLQAHGAEADPPGAFYLVCFHFRSRLGPARHRGFMARACGHPVLDGPDDRHPTSHGLEDSGLSGVAGDGDRELVRMSARRPAVAASSTNHDVSRCSRTTP